jgi:hypothetical protein
MTEKRSRGFQRKSRGGPIVSTRVKPEPQRQVAIQRFENDLDAEVAKGHLEAAGIEAKIIKDDAGGMFPSLQQTGGVQVLVAEAQSGRAREILREKLA